MSTEVNTKGDYILFVAGESRSKQAAALAAFLSMGKAGECIVRYGLTNETWALFLARLCARAGAAGHDEKAIASLLVGVSAGNLSAASKLLNAITIEDEVGNKNQLDEIVLKKKSALPASVVAF
jgi:hypothetical protein